MKLNVILFIWMFLFLACSNYKDKRLAYALEFAGDNRVELEKVLDHYKEDPEKLTAARFLIENMPYHFGYESWEVDTIKQIMADAIERKSLFGDDGLIVDKASIDKWKYFSPYGKKKVYDSKVIKADYLIENIDLSFEVWKKYPWNKSLSFDDFCELILPYRIADEPLSDWRKTYYDHYKLILDSLYGGTDVVQACNSINKILREEWFYYIIDFKLPHLSADYLFKTRVGYCRDACDIATYAMRSVGIPTTTDYYIYSPDMRTWHCWDVVRDTTGVFYPFWYTKEDVQRVLGNDGRRKGKAYRDCFGIQEERLLKFVPEKEILPFFRDCFVKDVTDNYIGMNQVSIPIHTPDVKYAYIGVFKNGLWEPVDIAEVQNGNAIFNNIEPDIVFQTLYVKDGRIETEGYPFVYTTKDIRYFKPDTEKENDVFLTRKYPVQAVLLAYMNRAVIGNKIEGATDDEFKNKIVLHEVKDSIRTNRNIIIWPKPVRSRYIRYHSPKNQRIELAELAFYSDTSVTEPLAMSIVKAVDAMHADERFGLKNIIDGDPLTFFRSMDSTVFVTLDLGKLTDISKLMFIPRNDENFIWPGDNYELFFQNGNQGWQSLGRQIATGSELTYAVPDGALLWLRNLTKGQEEQIFFIKDGQQIFSHDINFSKE